LNGVPRSSSVVVVLVVVSTTSATGLIFGVRTPTAVAFGAGAGFTTGVVTVYAFLFIESKKLADGLALSFNTPVGAFVCFIFGVRIPAVDDG